ncbi:MAG: SDR family NAD(P)-dependent oxidoreductase [Alphaproteobacteria bacterium]|uniref:SDR family NAD(P)-dependent oxidoreductase n=1 Tax=Sphingopyxis sp. RIFCSPHIGHO2_12_FULL_65_19 TaxID=1802172 RepID=UPI0008BA0F19|nr:SDR family NAD(P)-dependent oxidoreductase [Sphingopyxis sp. RIFCSPHIGHO2_12_FULL_65_19]MBU1258263.1 SDR family NAD(P)-dependent oxidoreductase [Alphaproteobacteria bacterium]MBU1463344.1 SDR family NAD(P)-dependent oxidoreductase [Alphaproteobacteria bacterium]OHD06277.1 MAG: hypothetical protein A3E77_13220 [Sphingopyxis sp. RIFCSPHIGHO2_12_FULL_65_19]
MAGKRALIIGSSGGIGGALVDALDASGDFERIYAGSRQPPGRARNSIYPLTIDILDESIMAAAAAEISREGLLDLVIVASGLLHRDAAIRPEKSFRQIDAASLTELLAVNSIGPALAAKHFLPLLAVDRRAVIAFLSARVGSIGDNRLGGWHGYRASKAALNALVRCFSIELVRSNPEAIAVALHPGTVDTRLSAPFQARLRPGSLFSARESAAHLLAVIGQLSPAESGGLFGWDGRRIPY